MATKKHREGGNQSGNKDNMDKLHIEAEHIKLEVNKKKGHIVIKKINANNIARRRFTRDCKSSQVECNVVTSVITIMKKNWTLRHHL